MESKLLILLLCLASVAHAQKPPVSVTYDAKVLRVIDGDTVAIEALWMPLPMKPEVSIRVYGVDTPEKGFRAKCEAEASKGEQATAFTKAQITMSTKVQVKLIAHDKYGGRVLGDVVIDGNSLRTMLIGAGLAREYYGDAKQSWCGE